MRILRVTIAALTTPLACFSSNTNGLLQGRALVAPSAAAKQPLAPYLSLYPRGFQAPGTSFMVEPSVRILRVSTAACSAASAASTPFDSDEPSSPERSSA